MNGYIAILHRKRIEIRAETLVQALEKAKQELKPSKRDLRYMVVALAELGDKPVIHTAVD